MNKKTISIIIAIVIIIIPLVICYIVWKKDNKKDKFFDTYPSQSGVSTVKIMNMNIKTEFISNISIAGVFVYDENGNSIPMPISDVNPSMNSTFGIYDNPEDPIGNAKNALKINGLNINRTLQTAKDNLSMSNNYGLLSIPADIDGGKWNEIHGNGYVSHSNLGGNPDWWQYTFSTPKNISAVEILPRINSSGDNSEYNYMRNKNITIQLLDGNGRILFEESGLSTTTNYNRILTEIPSQPTIAQSPTTPMMAPITTIMVPGTTTQSPATTPATTIMVPGTTTQSPATTPATTIMVPGTTTQSPATTMMALSTPGATQGEASVGNTTLPQLSPSQTIALLNSGVNLDTLTSQGIAMNSAYRGPSTNIVQTNFSGTSNIYSPYLYYNKGVSEQFSGLSTDTNQHYSSL
jgi:hypothetical protein